MISRAPASASTVDPHSARLSLPHALLLLVIGITVLIYWPGSNGGFVLDDYPNIVDNPALHIHDLKPADLLGATFSSRSGPLSRPLSMLSFALNEYAWGPSPYSMKITNILIHAINGLLIYIVATLLLSAYRRRWRPDLNLELVRWTALAITAAWLLLPINLTAVLYVVQRMTSLSATFVLAGVALYVSGRLRMLAGRRGLWMLWTGMLAGGGLAVLSKEAGALLPVYTLAIECTLFGFARTDGRRDLRLYLFYAIVLVIPGLLGLYWVMPHLPALSEHAGRPFTLGQRLLTEPRVVLDYIVWSLAPTLGSLSLYHDDYAFSKSLFDPASTAAAILGIALLLALALWQRRRRPLLSLGIFWFLGGQLLTATIFQLELVYEHRNYLPTFGLLLAVFSLLLLEPRVERMALARRGLVAGLILLYATVTLLRVQQWSNPLRFHAIAAAEHPNSPRATYALGRTYSAMIDSPHSRFLPLAIKAFDVAMRAPGSSILPEQGLLWLSAKYHMPMDASWWTNMQRKLSANPASAQDTAALYTLVNCQLQDVCDFPKPRMTEILRTAVRRNPRDPDIITIYANYDLNILRRYSGARAMMQKAVDLSPKTPQYWINLIKLDIFLGRYDDASKEIDQLAKLNRFGNLDNDIKSMRTRLATTQQQRGAQTPPADRSASGKEPGS